MEKARQPIRFALCSGASALLDIGLFYLLELLLGSLLGENVSIVCSIAARAISSFFNFTVNRRLVFDGGQSPYWPSLLRYYTLAIPTAGASTVLVRLVELLLHLQNPTVSTGIKAVVDTFLFVVNFFIQKFWVFRKKESR